MLRGASGEAQSELLGRLEDTSGDLAQVGEQLLGVAGVLRREASLRRVLTDASIEGDAKAGLAGNVFGSSVSAATLDLVSDAVRRRWTAGRDLADVLENAGLIGLVRSAGDQASRISDELFTLRRLIDANQSLRGALSEPGRTSADKSALLRGLLEGKVQQATLVLVAQATEGSHGSVDHTLEEFQHTAASAAGEQIATVHTARELSEGDRDRLAEALSQQYSTSVHLLVVLDPSVIGGLRVEIGDDVIDGTVANKLEDAQRRLAG